MQIKRDYSQPFFGDRRRRSGGFRFSLIMLMLLAIFAVLVYTQFGALQLAALDMVGMAPTATPFASVRAEQGAARFAAGDVASAVQLFALAASQQPENLAYLYDYGRLLIEVDTDESLAEAIAISDRMIALAPLDPRGYAVKSKTLVWQGDSAGAIPVGVAGLEADANFAPLYATLARAYTNIGRYQQGLEYGQRAIEIDPMEIDGHRSYAYALIWVGERELAINELEEAVSINPNFTPTYFELALQYSASNLDEYAIATYERILSLEPRNARAHLRLCESYSKVGQDAQAEGYCDDAIRLDSTYAAAYRQLGMVMYRRRNYEGAIDNFQECVDNGSEEIQCFYLRGLSHYYLGQCDEAWLVLTESLPMAEVLPGGEAVLADVREGLRLTTVSCAAYAGRPLPTIQPSPAPLPTPIGG